MTRIAMKMKTDEDRDKDRDDSVVIEAVERNPPAEPAPAGPDIVSPEHMRRASPCGRGEIPAHLPREIEVVSV
jgi:hypothetical protein